MAARDYPVRAAGAAAPGQVHRYSRTAWDGPRAFVVRMGTTWRLLLKELSAFGIVGAVCFAIDVVLFQVLYATPAWAR